MSNAAGCSSKWDRESSSLVNQTVPFQGTRMCTEKGGGGEEGKIRSGKTCQVFATLTEICQSQLDCSIRTIEFFKVIY